MGLFRKRKDGRATESRTTKIQWDPSTGKAVLHVRRGRVRRRRTVHADSLLDAERQIQDLIESMDD